MISPHELDLLRHRLVEDIARGLADVEAGRTQTAQLRSSLSKRRRAKK